MIFSVYNYRRGGYDYYEGAMDAPAVGWFRSPRAKHPGGATPEEAAVPLPANAKKVGQGDEPKGMIAAPSSSSSMLPKIIWGGGALLVGWWLYKKVTA